jgi:hypothetical protein
MDKFEAYKVPIICFIVHCIINKLVLNKDYLQFAFDLFEIECKIIPSVDDHLKTRTIHPSFERIFMRPQDFIVKQPHLRNMLELSLKEGKKLFVLSNYSKVWMDLVMTHTLGDGWQKLFEYSVYDTRQPFFYRAN